MGHEHPQGVPGDLLITLRLDAQEGRRWEDGRLIQEASVPISTLILGGSVRITTPLGKRIQIEVPERTKIGDRRRVNGHGHLGGDLDIEFVLLENDKLTKKQIKYLSNLEKPAYESSQPIKYRSIRRNDVRDFSKVADYLIPRRKRVHISVFIFTILMIPGILATFEPIDIESYEMESPETGC